MIGRGKLVSILIIYNYHEKYSIFIASSCIFISGAIKKSANQEGGGHMLAILILPSLTGKKSTLWHEEKCIGIVE